MVDSPASAVLNSGPVHQAVLNALDQLGLAVLVKDLSSGRYVYASDAASRLLHAGDDALEGVQDADIFDATQAVALRAADVTTAWEALTPGKRRGLLYHIDTAKTAPTRAKRIAAGRIVAGGSRSCAFH